MKSIHLKLLKAVSLLSLTMMAIPDAEAANIPLTPPTTAPPQTDEAMNFSAPAPGGTFIIEAGVTFTGALTTDGGAAIGTLVLNSGSVYSLAVGNPSILAITLNGNATTGGATGAQNFNLGQNTLTNTVALNLPSGTVLNTRVVSNALFGHIVAGGADSISGPSITVNVDATGVIALTPGQPLFIIGAPSGTSGLPVIVTSNNVLYSFIGENLNGNVTIIPTFNPAVLPPGGGGASGGVGEVFTALLAVAAANPSSDIASVISALGALPTAAAIQDALLQFNPIVDGALSRMSFDSAKQFQQLWALHMTNGRCIYPTECGADCLSCECCDPFINCGCVCNSWEVWADAFGLWGHQNKKHGFNGYNANLYGGMIGFQAPICRELSAGMGVGYANTHVKRSRDNDSTINMYDATAYLSFNPTHWYLDAAFSFDFNQYEDKRHIRFTGVDRTAKADYVGRQYTVLLASGYRYFRWCTIFTPLASIQYSHLSVNKYHEHGAGDLNLHVKGQHYNFLESSLGLKVARPFQTRHGVYIPEVHALWLYDFYGNSMDLTTTFSGVATAAGSFKTKGPSLARNRGDVGAGITYITCCDLAIEGVYNYEFSKRWHSHAALIEISKKF